jgi:hypothetical protein
MSVTIDIAIDEAALNAKLAALDGFLAAPGPQLLQAGYAVKEFVQIYHEEFHTGWRGDHYLTGPVSGRWETEVAADWQVPFQVDADTVLIENTNPTLAHKITGGTIVPVSAGALTIPLVGEAKGIRAAEYEEFTGNKLFQPKGTNILAAKIEGELVPIYALRSSVTQEPWPGAMPEVEAIQGIFDNAFQVELTTVLDL